jgi:hypothetical protein
VHSANIRGSNEFEVKSYSKGVGDFEKLSLLSCKPNVEYSWKTGAMCIFFTNPNRQDRKVASTCQKSLWVNILLLPSPQYVLEYHERERGGEDDPPLAGGGDLAPFDLRNRIQKGTKKTKKQNINVEVRKKLYSDDF